jgi:hypothetical protein
MVPVATIYIAWVPHLLLLPSPDVGYYVRFARQVVTSFLVTAAVFWAVARLIVTSRTLAFGWSTTVLPIATLVLIAGIYLYEFPSHDIDSRIDPMALESVYGERLDQVVGLLNIDNGAQRQSEIARLHSAFQSDPSVLRVTLPGPGVAYGGIFDYRSVDSSPNESCASAGPNQLILMRCTWQFRSSSQRQTLKYKRLVTYGGASHELILDLDYKEVLEVLQRHRDTK